MQGENRTASHFSQRTEAMAAHLGVPLKELPDRIGISGRMFYGYRSGKYPITDKAWRKLAQVERELGIAAPLEEQLRAAQTPEAKKEVLESSTLQEVIRMMGEQGPKIAFPLLLDRMEVEMLGFFGGVGGLVSLAQEAGITEFVGRLEGDQFRAHRNWQLLLDMAREAAGAQTEEHERMSRTRFEALAKEEKRIRDKKRKPPAPKSAPLQLVEDPPEDDRPRIARFEQMLWHAAAGAPIPADGDSIELPGEPDPSLVAVQLHGDSMEPELADGQVVLMRRRESLKRPLLKRGRTYLFQIGGEKTVKVYDSRAAAPEEIEAGLAYPSRTEPGRMKVRLLRSNNPAYAPLVLRPEDDPDWLAYLDPKDEQPMLSGPGRAQQRR